MHNMFQAYITQIILLLLLFLPFTISLSFNFQWFDQNNRDIVVLNDSFIANSVIQLTKNQQDLSLGGSVGRAYYSQPMQLWNKKTKQLTDFTTHFSYIIKQVNNTYYGDGLSFFLAPVNASVPINSTGGHLGLVSPEHYNDTSKNQFVAVEFDSYQNAWDPSADHVGIDVNSIVSVANVSWNSSIKNGSEANAWVTYNSSAKNLSVFLTYDDTRVFSGKSILSYIIDLRKVLPERVQVGFAASTGSSFEIHSIISWEFNSTLPYVDDSVPSHPPPFESSSELNYSASSKKSMSQAELSGLIVCTIFIVFGLGVIWCIVRRRRKPSVKNKETDFKLDGDSDDEDFEKGTGGPKRFTYHELSSATNDFSEDGKLGEGGFGGVYLGVLNDPSRQIAVKRISRGSKQGKKEYKSEVKVISKLRHRNLVQLLGWSHDVDELLLVYEYMPNGSLDYHLYGVKNVGLQWKVRYEIACGLASAVLYLHEEWEQCVIHRDIKSSNVMLDSTFNAKLGDFGLARLVEHGSGSQTTVLAGTLGYMAPECAITGKASKESDVYSFGVVALEIACGRRPVEFKEEPDKVRMVQWVWTLYGKGLLIEAVDKRLEGEFDIQQMESLMVVGLWCCHPDHTQRPSIRQVINALNQDSALPNLPSELPVPTYFHPPLNVDMLGITSSSGFTGSTGTTGSSSQSVLSGTAPLLP